MRKHPIKIAMGKTIRFMSKPWLVDLPCHLALDLTRNYLDRPPNPHAHLVCAPGRKAVTTALNAIKQVMFRSRTVNFRSGKRPRSSFKARFLPQVSISEGLDRATFGRQMSFQESSDNLITRSSLVTLHAAATWESRHKYRFYPVDNYDHFPEAVHLFYIDAGQNFSSTMGS